MKAGASSGHWRARANRPPSRATTWSMATCCWPRPAMGTPALLPHPPFEWCATTPCRLPCRAHPAPSRCRSTSFNAQTSKQLGIAVSQWGNFCCRVKTLSECKVKSHEAMNYFLRVLCQTDAQSGFGTRPHQRAGAQEGAVHVRAKVGAQSYGRQGHCPGPVVLTEFVDHERRARSQEYRLDSAWFGQGAALKQRALDVALQLAS